MLRAGILFGCHADHRRLTKRHQWLARHMGSRFCDGLAARIGPCQDVSWCYHNMTDHHASLTSSNSVMEIMNIGGSLT
jgi:hypothetical protein